MHKGSDKLQISSSVQILNSCWKVVYTATYRNRYSIAGTGMLPLTLSIIGNAYSRREKNFKDPLGKFMTDNKIKYYNVSL